MSTDTSLDIVPTRAMLLKRNITASSEFKAIVFESHKSKSKSTKLAKKRPANNQKDDSGLDLKRTRREVFNFGITGYDFQDQQKAKISLAVKLGAKPPKNQYKNYKDLQDELKKSKEKAKEDEYIQTVGKSSSGHATVSCNKLVNRVMKKRRANNDVGALTKHYGIVNPKIHKKKKKK